MGFFLNNLGGMLPRKVKRRKLYIIKSILLSNLVFTNSNKVFTPMLDTVKPTMQKLRRYFETRIAAQSSNS